MDFVNDHVLLSRFQFGLMTLFHILWPTLTIGLSLFILSIEAFWVKTRRELYFRQAQFWSRILILNFGVGVASGVPLEFAFGTNWAPFSRIAGSFIGSTLGFEAAMAFMLEAGFIGIAVFGWNRVGPWMHLFSTAMVAAGASISAFWIMVANAWIQAPRGWYWSNGRLLIDDYFSAVFNPDTAAAVFHMWFAALETSVVFIGGVSAWYILRDRHKDIFVPSFRWASAALIFIAPVQIYWGDFSGRSVAVNQPAKLAAMEAHWQTNSPGEGAPWVMLAIPDQKNQTNRFSIEVPDALSLLVTHTSDGKVQGLEDFPLEEQPPVILPFFAFRAMVLIGFALLFLALFSAWVWWRRGLTPDSIGTEQALLKAWVFSIPLGYAGVETGWITREVGRQPWLIQNILRTADGASYLKAEIVLGSLLFYGAVYFLLLAAFIVFLIRLIKNGPDLSMPLPPASDARRSRE